MRDLKYQGYTVAFQEVPEEISLVFNISGCERKCKGCHSEHLQEYTGRYLQDDYEELLDQYKDVVTCVCFMGGEQSIGELSSYMKSAKEKGLKVCVYSGSDDVNVFSGVLPHLDYLKIGSYNEKLGGISHPSTNQVFYQVVHGVPIQRNDLFHRRQNITLNTDNQYVERMVKQLERNKGYCPCSIKKNEGTKCMCRAFREQKTSGFCHCRLFYKRV